MAIVDQTSVGALVAWGLGPLSGQLGPISIDLRLMDKVLHDPKDPKLWELWYIPYNG